MPFLCFSTEADRINNLITQSSSLINARIKDILDSIRMHRHSAEDLKFSAPVFNKDTNGKICSVTSTPLPILQKIYAYKRIALELVTTDQGIILNHANSLINCKNDFYITKNNLLVDKIDKVDADLNAAMAATADKLKLASQCLAVIRTLAFDPITQVISPADATAILQKYIDACDDVTVAAVVAGGDNNQRFARNSLQNA